MGLDGSAQKRGLAVNSNNHLGRKKLDLEEKRREKMRWKNMIGWLRLRLKKWWNVLEE